MASGSIFKTSVTFFPYAANNIYIWGASTDIPVDTSVDTRPIYRTIPNDSPLNDAHGIDQRIDRDTDGRISVNHRLYIGQLSVKYRVDYQSIYGSIHLSTLYRYRSTTRGRSADTRHMYRPILDCTVSADVSTDVSTDLKYN